MRSISHSGRSLVATLLAVLMGMLTANALADGEIEPRAFPGFNVAPDDQSAAWTVLLFSECPDRDAEDNCRRAETIWAPRRLASKEQETTPRSQIVITGAVDGKMLGECPGGAGEGALPETENATAREILKLRRAVGRSAVAGTIFDSGRPVWVEDPLATKDAGRNAEHGGEDEELAIAEIVRRLDEEAPGIPETRTEFADGPAPEAPNPWAEHLLRPAERRLAEAAELLEQAGQYDRADAARELAAQVRQEARRVEMRKAAPPIVPSPVIWAR